MKSIYAFEDADSKNRMLLGGKGAGLSEMTRLKLPVPPGFTITTEVCNKYYDNGKKLPKDVMPLVCLLYTSPSPRDLSTSRMPSSA